jgi:hypothetical protein
MKEASFESMVESVTASLRASRSIALPLDEALSVTRQKQSEREGVLAAVTSGTQVPQGARDWLTIFDVAAAACAVALSDKSSGALSTSPLAGEVTDLWIQATAARALWLERYAQWPNEDPQKKEQALLMTAKEVGGAAISLATRLGLQPTQFTAYVASLAGVKTC